MKKVIALAVLALSLSLTGCGPTPGEAAYQNAINFSNPQKIGTLPDGRPVSRIIVTNPNSQRDHYIYIVPGKASVTANYEVSQGKTTVLETNAFVE